MGDDNMLVDLRVAQLLCSRLCHDLVGPAGAVTAGLELLHDEPEGADEALILVADSGQQVVRRLAFFRMAFGIGGGGAATRLAEIRDLAQGLLSEGSVVLNWPSDAAAGERPITATGGKLLLNLLLLGVDTLPRGGTLDVELADSAEGLDIAMTAAGQGARLRDEVRTALHPDMPAEDLTARTVQGYFAQRLAEALGGAIEISDDTDDQVRLALILPDETG